MFGGADCCIQCSPQGVSMCANDSVGRFLVLVGKEGLALSPFASN